jgi:hypothetical protein
MTTTTPTPTKTDPQPPQTSAGRSLRMVGVVLAALFVATAAWGAIGTLASAWGGRDATTATATYPARPTVELDADGDVTVSSGGDRVVVERTSRVPFGHVRYSVEDSTDRLLVRHRCPVLVSGSCRPRGHRPGGDDARGPLARRPGLGARRAGRPHGAARGRLGVDRWRARRRRRDDR